MQRRESRSCAVRREIFSLQYLSSSLTSLWNPLSRAEEFASRGCRVFATARSITKMRGLSSGIQQIQLDVLSDESVEKAVQTIIDKEGRIDCLVNSAGANRIGESALSV
jgi:NADP-dependent 3-hydroxy acid dehydrogenase YdfG